MLIDYYSSPVGGITLFSVDGTSLSGLKIDGQSNVDVKRCAGDLRFSEAEIFQAAKDWLNRYFAGEKTKYPDFKIIATGSPFREEVWRIIGGIPYGKTMTYGEIAEIIAFKRGVFKVSAQAVGGAVGHNPVSIMIPCHRVIGANGNLVGYGGGIELKKKLLAIEGFDMSLFHEPKRK